MTSLRHLAVLVLLTCLAACVRGPELCGVCRREVHESVRTTLTLDGGREVVACFPRCALHYQQEQPGVVREIRVTDHAGGGVLPFRDAYLVEGSDETPCMRHHAAMTDESKVPMQICYDRCMPSLIAFKEASAARAFAADHGGTVYAPATFPGLPAPATR